MDSLLAVLEYSGMTEVDDTNNPEIETGSNAPAEPAQIGLVQQFFLESLDLLGADNLKTHLRLVPDGIFVEEIYFVELARHFALWQARKLGGSASLDEKTIRKLLGSDFPPLFYLIEGKLCLSGFKLPHILTPAQKTGIAVFQGTLLNACDFLHPKDSRLNSTSGVEARVEKSGLVVRLALKTGEVRADTAFVQSFQKNLMSSYKLKKRYPEGTRALRAALLPLYRLLSNAQRISEQQMLFVPAVFRRNKAVQFYRNGGFIFVLSDDGKLLDSYELRGANLYKLVMKELEALRTARVSKIGCLELMRKSGPTVGFLHTSDGERNSLHIQLVLDFMQLMVRRRSLRKKLAKRVTLYDCLSLVADLFAKTTRVEARELPRSAINSYLESRERHKPAARPAPQRGINKSKRPMNPADQLRYRAGAGWIFFIHDQHTVRACMERPKEVVKKVLTLHDPKELLEG